MREIKTELDLLRLRDYNVYMVSDRHLTTGTHEWEPHKIYFIPYMNQYLKVKVIDSTDETGYCSMDKFLHDMFKYIRRVDSTVHELSMDEFDRMLDKSEMMKELIK